MYTFFSKNQCSAEKILGLVGMMIKQIFSEQFVDWYIGFNILLRPLSVRIPTSVFVKNQSETLMCFPMAKYACKTRCWCQNLADVQLVTGCCTY